MKHTGRNPPKQGAKAYSASGLRSSKDPLAKLVSFIARAKAHIGARIWFVVGLVCPGFVMVTGKKAVGKSFLLSQMAIAIGNGELFCGRKTTRAKVLLVSFELDEFDMTDRFKGMRRLSDNAFIVYGWSTGEEAFKDAERAITEFGFSVLIFDTFLPMIPREGGFSLNEYGDTGVFLRWRLLGKRLGAAIVASWHEGKTARGDFKLNAIGSTGMVAQADSVLSLERKGRGERATLRVAGNHAPDCVIALRFAACEFSPVDGGDEGECLTLNEGHTLASLADFPQGATAAQVAKALGKTEDATRKSLERLIARGKVAKPHRGAFVLACSPAQQAKWTLDKSGQNPDTSERDKVDGHGHTPIGVSVPVRIASPANQRRKR